MEGFLYILSNKSMPGLLKIGKTQRTPTERSKELFTTGVAAPFEIVFAIHVDDVDEFEVSVHEMLDRYRYAGNREFFKVEVFEAVKWITNLYFLDRFDLVAVFPNFAFNESDLFRYADICGTIPHAITDILKEISPSAWKAASARFDEKLERCSQERETALEVWGKAVSSIDGMLADFALTASEIEVTLQGWEVYFPTHKSREYCDVRIEELSQVVESEMGRHIELRFFYKKIQDGIHGH